MQYFCRWLLFKTDAKFTGKEIVYDIYSLEFEPRNTYKIVRSVRFKFEKKNLVYFAQIWPPAFWQIVTDGDIADLIRRYLRGAQTAALDTNIISKCDE